MLLRVGLKLCQDAKCFNSKGKHLAINKSAGAGALPYCRKCVESGFDYVYANEGLFDASGNSFADKGHSKVKPIEESLYIQKIRRRGAFKGRLPPIGLFSRREYLPNEQIGYISGTVAKISLQRKKPAEKRKGPCRCFIFREKNLMVDARYIGNLSRFIRRSCRPNVGIALEVQGEEWAANPPLKKMSGKPPQIRAKLYALSKIYSNAELLLGESYSARAEEMWGCSEVAIEPEEFQESCCCSSQWTCLFEKSTADQEKNFPEMERSEASLLFSKIHRYVEDGAPLSNSDLSFILRRKCSFIGKKQ